jgi:hypothetical protein
MEEKEKMKAANEIERIDGLSRHQEDHGFTRG